MNKSVPLGGIPFLFLLVISLNVFADTQIEVVQSNGILVAGPAEGRNAGSTLYINYDDVASSQCLQKCPKFWSALVVNDGVPSNVSDLGSIVLEDGRSQVTYNGMPLYLYSKDRKDGDAKGTGQGGNFAIAEYSSPEPVDSDNDGVTDDVDQCPNTAAGVSVDANGCEIVSNDPVSATATASSNLQPASFAVDGNMSSRWESNHGVDPSWLTLDLGQPHDLSQVVIHWEAANADTFSVQGSNDNVNWQELATLSGGVFGDRTDSFDVTGIYRYVRMYGTLRSMGNDWGYSIYEMEVYGAPSEPPADSDGDGVDDTQDQCPGTPAGAQVDSNGCQVLDSDNDGVNDSVDQCPQTPAGAQVDAQGCAVDIGEIVPLFSAATMLEPETVFTRPDGVVVTRLADRGRDRHAKDSTFNDHYDHYLANYWSFRTARIQFEDYVPTGQSRIDITFITEWELSVNEIRAWYWGINATGQFHHNLEPDVVSHGEGLWDDNFQQIGDASQGDQWRYTVSITRKWENGGQQQIPLQGGERMEFELSQFLIQPPEGSRLNYYGTTFLYIVGEGGMKPFEWEPGTYTDGYPIASQGLLGGNTTLGYNYTNEPAGRFMQMATNLSHVNGQNFVEGRRVHHTDFVTGGHDERYDNPIWPEQVSKAGNYYINSACSNCHVRNGRALVAEPGESLDKWVFKVGDEGGSPHPELGRVLQPQQTGSGPSEGDVTLGNWTDLPSGLREPNYVFSGTAPETFSARIAPQLVGLGLLEAVSEATILEWADPDAAGISGRASVVTDPVTGDTRLGRFGYKASTSSVEHQVAAALNTDIGVMTSVLPEPDCGSAQNVADCGSSGAELSDEHLDDLVKYVSLLGVPARRDLDDPEALQGESLFNTVGCADCHRPSMQTSQFHPLTELRDQTIYPYTDMLLHDMGPGLADSLGEGSASGAEWRTAPLWGLGHSESVMAGDVKGNTTLAPVDDAERNANLARVGYLHDGRARTIDEAIRWHGGEAQPSADAYTGLSASDKDALLKFLRSL